MTYEVLYSEGFDDDVIDLNIDDNAVISIHGKLETIAKHPKPLLLTERVMNTDFRKIQFSDHRIFLHIDESAEVIYVLTIKHHNKCYKPKEIKKLISLLEKVHETTLLDTEDDESEEDKNKN